MMFLVESGLSPATAAGGHPRALAVAVALVLAVPMTALGQPSPPDLRELEQRAQAYYAEDRLEQASATYVEIAERQTDGQAKARALVLAAWLQQLAGRPDRRPALLDQALRADPEHTLDASLFNPEFVTAFDQSKRRNDELRENERAIALHQALDHLRAGNDAAARPLLEGVVANLPSDPEANLYLARIESAESPTSALDRLERLTSDWDAAGVNGSPAAPASPPLQAAVYRQIAVLALRQAKPEAAAAAARRAVEIDPDSPEGWNTLGASLEAVDDRSAAVDAYRRARLIDPNDPRPLRNLVVALATAERHGEILELRGGLEQLLPDDPEIALYCGLAHLELGDSARAVVELERALALDRGNQAGIAFSAAGQLAALYYRDRRFAEAEAAARRAVELDPKSTDSLATLALVLLAADQPAVAVDLLERARALSPPRADFENNLGNALFAAGRYSESAAAFERALDLDPTMAVAARNLERARSATGSPPQAPAGEPPTHPATPAAKATPASGIQPTPTATATASTAATAPPTSTTPPAAPAPAAGGPGFRLLDRKHVATGRAAAEVAEMTAGGRGDRAGLEDGDLILRAAGQPVASAAALLTQLSSAPDGARIRLDLIRDGRAMSVFFD